MAGVNLFVLVRHGETVGESSIRYHGNNDVVLSRKGRIQAERLRAALESTTFDRVVSSPLARAWQTATVLAPMAEIEIEPVFKEIHFGRWEGMTMDEIREKDPDLQKRWISREPGFEYPGGEARHLFRERVQTGLDRLLALEAASVLVVAHKGVVRQLAEGMTRSPLPEAVPELAEALTVQRVDDGSWQILEDLSGR